MADAPSDCLRIARDEAVAGTEVTEYHDTVLHLDAEPALTGAHIAHVRPVLREDRLILEIEFTADGADRMRTATRENVGRRTAFLLDGTVLSAPAIATEVAVSNGFQAGLIASPAEAERIADRIRTRWPERAGLLHEEAGSLRASSR